MPEPHDDSSHSSPPPGPLGKIFAGSANLDDFLRGLERLSPGSSLPAAGLPGLPARVNADPHNVERGLAQLVLTLIELLRQLMERQAIRRMEGGTLADDEVERVGLALMRLEEKIREIAAQFGLGEDDIQLRIATAT